MDGLEINQCQRMTENIGLDLGNNKAAFDQVVDIVVKLYQLFAAGCLLLVSR